MRKIHFRHLKRCMKVVSSYCDENHGIWSDSRLQVFLSDQQNMSALETLAAQGNIEIKYYNNVPVRVSIKSNGKLFFLRQEEKRKERIYGFVSGVLSTFAAEFLIWWIVNIL